MIANLENLLTQDQINQLVNAINENKDYEVSNNGLIIKSSSTDNSLSLLISYEEGYKAKEEADKFKTEYLDTLDDDLFIEVCDHLGKSKIEQIQECLESNELESVRAGIAKFKSALSEVAKEKIKLLEAYV